MRLPQATRQQPSIFLPQRAHRGGQCDREVVLRVRTFERFEKILVLRFRKDRSV